MSSVTLHYSDIRLTRNYTDGGIISNQQPETSTTNVQQNVPTNHCNKVGIKDISFDQRAATQFHIQENNSATDISIHFTMCTDMSACMLEVCGTGWNTWMMQNEHSQSAFQWSTMNWCSHQRWLKSDRDTAAQPWIRHMLCKRRYQIWNSLLESLLPFGFLLANIWTHTDTY